MTPLGQILEDIQRRDWHFDVTHLRWAEVYLVGVNGEFESATSIEEAIRKAYRAAMAKVVEGKAAA